MKQQVANYTVIIEKQKRIGTDKICYMAFVPTLGIATEADTLSQAKRDIRSLIQFHLKSLTEEGEPIPLETESAFVTRSEVLLPKGAITAQ